MRRTKREIIAAEASNDEDMLTAKSILLRRQREEYAKFSKEAGLLTQNERTQVYGFGKSVAQKARWKAEKALDNNSKSDIIKETEKDMSRYIGQPIIKTDNQHVREWYYANVSDIPNQVDSNLLLVEQAKQVFALRNKYKHQARVAMADVETAEMLEKKRPAPTFDELVDSKMKRKGMTEDEAIEDILKTASKTNDDVNKEFGL